MKTIKRIEEIFIATCLIIATVILSINVVLRYGFAANPSWVEELVRYLMIAITFIGSAVCFRKGTHICVDFILTFTNKKTTRILNIAVHILTLFFLTVLTFYSSYLVILTFQSGQLAPALGIPFFFIYLAIPIGTILSIIHLIVATPRIWKGEAEVAGSTPEVMEES
ncbi:TRAP transporter small permease [Oceanobacillus timonensis]|uniref:TRAP transporter small permease n=1 Tax=Oceanobacillus timonensis TaxID=1926285 RepID=UPI0015C4C50F|nr:TRAP transporter small permease [Oceanobacillus timonensis]